MSPETDCAEATALHPQDAPLLVLASSSPARRALLAAAGVAFTVLPSAIDEAAARQALASDGADAGNMAEVLAELKARQVSLRTPNALVLGADQILSCDGRLFEKPGSVSAVRDQLVALRGRSHSLATSAVLCRDGERLWHHTDHAHLAMREFSDTFIEAYLAEEGAKVTGCVGGYRLEGAGVQLFSGVEGSSFTVLGLPLLPLLDILRAQGALMR